MDGILRHSRRKRGETDVPSLSARRHSLTLPEFFLHIRAIAQLRK